PESWVEDIATAKSNPNRPATEIYRDLRSAAASGWDFSSRWMDLYGIKKLRELILELAVRGKLVPQDPNDEPASVLLERIAAEK
ncbi:hypothetical protein MJN54_34945, partial [Salmonella enterica subsp. enterica serovar Kentucky]|nr:hypothetical protein [Salmonella enterica subsp. enterica serovar Kentucky]